MAMIINGALLYFLLWPIFTVNGWDLMERVVDTKTCLLVGGGIIRHGWKVQLTVSPSSSPRRLEKNQSQQESSCFQVATFLEPVANTPSLPAVKLGWNFSKGEGPC